MGITDYLQQQIGIYHRHVCTAGTAPAVAFARRLPGMMSCIGIVLAFIGLILLAGPENNLLALGPGEIIVLVGAIAIAAEIILISAWAGKVDVKRVTVVQLATASLVAFATMKRPESPCRRCLPV